MKANAIWIDKRRSLVDNGRGHSFIVDLPGEKGGDNGGPTALEAAAMALAGCVTTIFSGVAPKRHILFTRMEVFLDAQQAEGARTISSVNGVVDVYTGQSEADVRTAFDVTMRECPVDILFEQAGVNVKWTLNVKKPTVIAAPSM